MIYRSPEWLRWLIDFEICTGEDIKGKPSKRKQAKIDAKLAADRAADEAKRLAAEAAARQYQRDYDRMVREARQRAEDERIKAEKESRQRKVNKELDDLYDRMLKDWTRNPYTDKISTPNVRGEVHFHFKFENGHTFKVEGNNLVFSDGKTIATFTTNPFTRSKFVNLANTFTNNSKTRPSKSSSSYSDFDFDDFFSDFKKGYGQRQGSGGGYNSGRSQQQSQQQSKSRADQQARSQNTHPKAERYNSLLDTVIERKRQLDGMKKGHDWDVMNNELQAAITTAKRMKEKYNFKY